MLEGRPNRPADGQGWDFSPHNKGHCQDDFKSGVCYGTLNDAHFGYPLTCSYNFKRKLVILGLKI
jgi:hypothetical protein